MTVQELFSKVRDVVGQSVTTVDDGLFLYLSDWQDAKVTFTQPSGLVVEGTVVECDPDGDAQCVWLYVQYGDTRFDCTWLTDGDVTYRGK